MGLRLSLGNNATFPAITVGYMADKELMLILPVKKVEMV